MEGTITVIVVDANDGTRRGLVRRLRQEPGLAVIGEATDAVEALGMVADGQPDVVVLDPRAIGGAGAELVARMRAVAPDAGIVVLTAYVTGVERSELTRAGAGAVVVKEIDSESLVRTIRTVAARSGAGDRRSAT
jgi:two-component system nitrate/nitrite response regulator NarL